MKLLKNKKAMDMPQFIALAVIGFIILIILFFIITRFTGFGSEEYFRNIITKMVE